MQLTSNKANNTSTTITTPSSPPKQHKHHHHHHHHQKATTTNTSQQQQQQQQIQQLPLISNNHDEEKQINEIINNNLQEQQQIEIEIIKPKSRRGSLLSDPVEYSKVVCELIKTLQQNEILTLKQLYGNEFTILKQSEKCYRISLSFILPTDRIGLNSFTTSLLENENFEDYCTVSKLPPIHLTFKYNDSYPLLSSVEYFKLDCEWLSENCLCTLSNQLITLWNENINLPIISIWSNWLKNDSLFFLNLYTIRTTTTIITKPYIVEDNSSGINGGNGNGNCNSGDNTVIKSIDYEESTNTHYSLTLPPMYINYEVGQDPIQFLVDYDIEHELPLKSNNKVCTLCSSNHHNKDFINIFNCNHDFCKECLSAYITINIENDTLENIICPDQDCQVLLSPFEIKELVSLETCELYLERLKNNNCDHCDQVLKLLNSTNSTDNNENIITK